MAIVPPKLKDMTMHAKTIAVMTGTRAEYGLLFGTISELRARGANVQLIVTGAHLSPEHGMTVNQIEADGMPIAARVPLALADDTTINIVHAMATGLSGMADALTQLNPDIVVILGDRYEMLSAATAAAMLNYPIAHIHGGEVTEGAIDEAIRHAITKLSYWHFATADAYAKRIVQLGEHPERVFTVGAPGIDQMLRLPTLSREAFAGELGITLNTPTIVCTYHPETLAKTSINAQLDPMLEALAAFPEASVIITGANADAGGNAVNERMQCFAASRPNTLFKMSLGSRLYLNAMRHADVVLGNSSSGVIEAPVLGRATVNIGNRQAGRIRAATVIDCDNEATAIRNAIRKALSPEFVKTLAPQTLFGVPGKVAPAIADALMAQEIPASLRKAFYDLAQ